MKTQRQAALVALLSTLMAIPPQGLLAAEEAADQTFDFFLQEAQVITASRRAQKKSDSPVAIDVITREEIAMSGAQEISDLLRFRAGLDVIEVASIEGNPVQINVRGLPGEFSQSLQVLVDGRSVVSAFNSGIFWRNLPASLEEIERIEIVRGPNSALFGANAGQGVINIITRKAGAENGSAKVEAGQFGLFNTFMSAGVGSEKNGARLSYSGRQRGSYPQWNGDTGKDMDSRPVDQRLNARAAFGLWDGGSVDLFAGRGERRFLIPNPVGPTNATARGDAGYYEGGYLMAQLRQSLGEQGIELNLSRRDDHNQYSNADTRETVYDADLLGRFTLLDGRSVSTLGGSLRQIRAESEYIFNYNGLGGAEAVETNRQGRAYLAESLSLADWLSVALAGSLETSDLAGQYPAYQGALILKPLESQTLRLSGSRSPAMPSLQNTRGDILIQFASVTLPGFLSPTGNPGTFPVGILASGTDVHPVQMTSYEATWTSTLMDRRVVSEITAFQMEIDGYITFDAVNPTKTTLAGNFAPMDNGGYTLIPSGANYILYKNTTNIILRGVETALTFKPLQGTTLQLNHTYEDVQYENPYDPKDPFVEGLTPWNKLNLVAMSDIAFGLNAAVNVGWVGKHVSYLGSRGARAWIEDQAKVDLRLGYRPVKQLEVYAVAMNLDHAFRTEGLDGMAQPQSYYAGLNFAWGGK